MQEPLKFVPFRSLKNCISTIPLQAFELLVLNALDWDLNAVTPVLWRDLILEFIEKHVNQASLDVVLSLESLSI